MDTLVLFVTLEEKFSIFHYQAILTVGFLCMAFIMLMYVPSIPTSLKIFILKECYVFSTDFFRI